MAKNDEYVLRGQRVEHMSPEHIQFAANRAMSILKVNNRSVNRMDEFIENLWDRHSINVEVIDDHAWFGFAEALCDPGRFTIAIPNKLYTRITKNKDIEAIFIFFHELGHLLLGHKPALHYSLFPPSRFEDAEWQADFFAEIILDKLGGGMYKQLQLSFE